MTAEKKPSCWSTPGFFIGLGLNLVSLVLAFFMGPWVVVVSLMAAIIFGILNHKFGYVSGFLAGLLICIGLAFLVLIIVCGPVRIAG